MEDRQAQAVEPLKNAKAQGLNFYEATQGMRKQDFTQLEIEQVSYQFLYSDAAPPTDNDSAVSKAVNQAFAEAIVHQEAIDNAKQELHEDVAKTLLGGNSLLGDYYGAEQSMTILP